MDKAIIGACRIGYFRIGVTINNYEVLMKQLKNIPTPYPKILVDGDVDCIIVDFLEPFDGFGEGFEEGFERTMMDISDAARLDVYTTVWHDLKKTLKAI